MNNDMNSDDFEDLPSPDDIAEEAELTPRKVPLRDYAHALSILRSKGYSYADIAEWISTKLGAEVSRSQVTYVLNTPQEVQAQDAEEERLEDEADEMPNI